MGEPMTVKLESQGTRLLMRWRRAHALRLSEDKTASYLLTRHAAIYKLLKLWVRSVWQVAQRAWQTCRQSKAILYLHPVFTGVWCKPAELEYLWPVPSGRAALDGYPYVLRYSGQTITNGDSRDKRSSYGALGGRPVDQSLPIAWTRWIYRVRVTEDCECLQLHRILGKALLHASFK